MNIEIETDKKINIYALWEGKQLILCKGKENSSLIPGKEGKWICLWPSVSDELKMLNNAFPKGPTEFLPSDEGKDYIKQISGHNNKNAYIAKVEYVQINGVKKELWEELKAKKEFVLWDVEKGPMKYFEKKGKHLLAIYQVFEMDFSIREDDTMPNKHGQLRSYYKKLNETFSKNIVDGFEQKKPVISPEEFHRRKNLILEIVKKYPVHVGVRQYRRKEPQHNSPEISQETQFPDTKYCIYCRTKLISKAKFCSECGGEQTMPGDIGNGSVYRQVRK